MKVFVEKFADLKILRYKLIDFEKLNVRKKQYVYYLGLAARCGRDILWDQNNRYNLKIRKLLETIYKSYSGNRSSKEFLQFEIYLKRVWFSNGIHHHYSMDKIIPDFSKADLVGFINSSNAKELSFYGEIGELIEVITDPDKESKRVSLDSEKDLLLESAMNYYNNVSQSEAEAYYNEKRKLSGEKAPSFGLNTQLVKKDGVLSEVVWKTDGKYGKAIKQIVFYLGKAITFAENELQKVTIQNLIEYYKTGDLKLFDEYSISWVKELEGDIDFC